ncbi:hypothetical protein [Sporomusa sp. KB1]|nr:hypothetical protein [Sporomusa sp. KB1]
MPTSRQYDASAFPPTHRAKRLAEHVIDIPLHDFEQVNILK